MSFAAIYDANVLFPFEVRDILMVAARTSSFAVYWTDAILDEATHNLIAKGLATTENMTRMVAKMKELYPEATIPLADYEELIPVMTNNAKDRHVLAAAVAKKVNVIVTHNLKHLTDTTLKRSCQTNLSGTYSTWHPAHSFISSGCKHLYGKNQLLFAEERPGQQKK